MSVVDETIVREYFEAHGFLVSQRRKYAVQVRRQAADEEISLIVLNPTASGPAPSEFELSSALLPRVGRAVVAVKGWHTEVFAPSVLAHNAKIFRFVEPRVVAEAVKLVGGDGLLKLLVIPGLPKDEGLRARSIELLRAKGVDGVISFREMLSDLLGRVQTNRNYHKSELLQTLRLLKNYDLLKEPQLELQLRGRPRRTRPAADSE